MSSSQAVCENFLFVLMKKYMNNNIIKAHLELVIAEFTGGIRVQKCAPCNIVPYNKIKHCCVHLVCL